MSRLISREDEIRAFQVCKQLFYEAFGGFTQLESQIDKPDIAIVPYYPEVIGIEIASVDDEKAIKYNKQKLSVKRNTFKKFLKANYQKFKISDQEYNLYLKVDEVKPENIESYDEFIERYRENDFVKSKYFATFSKYELSQHLAIKLRKNTSLYYNKIYINEKLVKKIIDDKCKKYSTYKTKCSRISLLLFAEYFNDPDIYSAVLLEINKYCRKIKCPYEFVFFVDLKNNKPINIAYIRDKSYIIKNINLPSKPFELQVSKLIMAGNNNKIFRYELIEDD